MHEHTQDELDRRVLAPRSEDLGFRSGNGYSHGFVVILLEPGFKPIGAFKRPLESSDTHHPFEWAL